VYSVNARGLYHGLHFAVPNLLARGGGAILNISGIRFSLPL